MNNKPYGIDEEFAHPRALELIPDAFFWSCIDDLAPFGSDDGDTALAEFRNWRKEHPSSDIIECIAWVIQSVGDMKFHDYNDTILSKAIIKKQIEDENFDDQQYIYTLDVSIIATAFAQLVDEGTIDATVKPIVSRALERQMIWSELLISWENADQYIANLQRLEEVLQQA